jgi:drug/metabolite transporter (DMT)-like permease
MMFAGQLAALGAALCWSMCSLCFTEAGRKIGSLSVGLIRMVLGVVFLSIYSWALTGSPLPLDASSKAWSYLLLSGVAGFFIGDVFLFRSFLLVGPRLSLAVMASWPVLSSLLGWMFLGEKLPLHHCLGILISMGGIIWVIHEQNNRERVEGESGVGSAKWLGIMMAFLGALGQAVGLVLSKSGMEMDGGMYDPFSATLIRAYAGTASYLLLFLVLNKWRGMFPFFKDRRVAALLTFGSLTGPFLGVAFSLVAIQHTSLGIASTLTASSPILVIPFVVIFYGERVGLKAIVGTVLAVMGAVLLFW